jgi:hypothetical protein
MDMLNEELHDLYPPWSRTQTMEFVCLDMFNVELHDLYPSPSIIRIIKSPRVRWAGDVARMGEKRNAYRLLVGKPERETTRKTKT